MPCEPIRDRKMVKEMLEALAMSKDGFRDALLFEIGLDTGLRISDILRLTKGDIENGMVRIKTQKTGKFKLLRLKDRTWRNIQAYTEYKKDDDLLFPFSRQNVHKKLKAAADLCGLNPAIISSHTMRKTAGWHFYYDSGRDLAKTVAFLGHRNPAETLTYLMIDEEEVNKTLATMRDWYSA